MVPVEVKEQCGEGHGDKGLKGTWRGLPPFLPRSRQKVGLTKAKHGTKSGLRVERPKDLAGERTPPSARAAKGGATGKQRGGQRGESASGLEAGERVVI